MMTASIPACELCEMSGGELIQQGELFRVVLVDDANYPGFCRVIWRDHVKEITDLNELDRMLMMDVMWQVEQVVREVMQPEKINLASLGNMVPHLHWHVIPRYTEMHTFQRPCGPRLSVFLRQSHWRCAKKNYPCCVRKYNNV